MVFHNRTGIVALAAAVLVIVLGGFGCKRATPDIPAPPTGVQDDISNVTWTEYRSEVLGITLPYPEGWYVAEDPTYQSISLYEAVPPPMSDAPDVPTDAFFQCHDASLEDIVAQLGTAIEDGRITKKGRSMRRMVFEMENSDGAALEMYLWESAGKTCRASGPVGSARLGYILDGMEVRP